MYFFFWDFEQLEIAANISLPLFVRFQSSGIAWKEFYSAPIMASVKKRFKKDALAPLNGRDFIVVRKRFA